MCFFLPPKLTIDPSNREQQHLGVSCMERIRHHPAPPTRFFFPALPRWKVNNNNDDNNNNNSNK